MKPFGYTNIVGLSTGYTDTGLKYHTNYTYRVSAINSVGTSLPSTTSAITWDIAPLQPIGLIVTATSSSQIDLNWNLSSSAGPLVFGYTIERSADGGTTWSTIVSNTGSTSTTYYDTGVTSSTTYTYQVSAINSVGTGQPSNTASVTTQVASSANNTK